MTTGVLYKLDKTGHGEVAKWGDDAESRAAGDAAFKALAEKGFTMFDISDPAEPKPPLKEFDPAAREVLAVPRLVAAYARTNWLVLRPMAGMRRGQCGLAAAGTDH